jgi:DNA-binding transcriptional LysR family regulator
MILPSATDLIYFQTVATLQHISRAAIKLNVSQPSISMAIKRLEDSLDCHLFIRHKKGVTLTRAGDALLNETDALLKKWRQIKKNLHAVQVNVTGHVTIGCNSTLAPFFSERIAKLLTMHPGLTIHLRHESTDKMIQDIAQANLDIGVTISPASHADIVIKKIADVDFTFWCAKKLGGIIDIHSEDIPIICNPESPFTQHLMEALQKKRKRHRKPLRLITSSQLEAIAAMTASNCGVGILPSCFAEKFFADKLSHVIGAPIYKAPMCLSYRHENKKVAAINIVLEELRDFIELEFGQKKELAS